MSNQKELSKIAHLLWTDYHSKGKKPPHDLLIKFKTLQGITINETDLIKQDQELKEKELKADALKKQKDKKQAKIKKIIDRMWSKYNSKGERPPIELIRQLAFLQGKPKKEVEKMEYPTFDDVKPPYSKEATEEDFKFWERKPQEDDVNCWFPYDGTDRWRGIDRINEETPIMDILTNKSKINPLPLFNVRPSARGYLWDERELPDPNRVFPPIDPNSKTIKTWIDGHLVDTGKSYPCNQ